MARHSKKYKTYLGSAKWRDRRRYLLALRPHKGCQRAGCAHVATECHHLHYRTLGAECLEDVEFLCSGHHVAADLERQQREEIEATEREEEKIRRDHERELEKFARRRWGAGWRKRVLETYAESCLERHLEETEP